MAVRDRGIKKGRKFEKLIEAARSLFFRHGIRRVSISEICSVAGVSKMTFYRYFENKHEIAKYILDEIVADMMGRIREIMQRDIPFEEQMHEIMSTRIKVMNDFSQEFLADLYDDESDMGKHLLQKRNESFEQLRKMFAKAQQAGEIRKNINIDFIMVMGEYLRNFMRDERIRILYADPAERSRVLNDYFLYGILGREKK